MLLVTLKLKSLTATTRMVFDSEQSIGMRPLENFISANLFMILTFELILNVTCIMWMARSNCDKFR